MSSHWHKTKLGSHREPKAFLCLALRIVAAVVLVGLAGYGCGGAADKPSEAMALVGTGCDPSPLPPEVQLDPRMKAHFNDTQGKCYDFIVSGFPASWQLGGVSVIRPDGSRNELDPIWQVTGSGASAYLPSRCGLVVLFASSRNYPAGKWRLDISDQEGHEAASDFVYP